MSNLRLVGLTVVSILSVSFVTAQTPKSGHDLRESVTKKDGSVVRGRILSAHGEEVVIVQGTDGRGKKLRVARDQVASIDSLRDRMTQFFVRRKEAGKDVAKLWKLAQWAGANKLTKMARLQAMEVVLLDDDHEAAHRYLGHKKKGKVWYWRRGGSFRSKKGLEAYTSKWGHPLQLDLPHYEFRTNAPLAIAVAAAFDMEALYVEWYRQFGEVWELHEVLDPLRTQLYRNEKDFPALSSRERPYVLPDAVNDLSRTWVHKDGKPVHLLATVTQHLIYRSLVQMRLTTDDPRSHVCAWMEIGLGLWMESCFRGDFGRRVAGAPEIDTEQLRALTKFRKHELKNFIHRDYTQFMDTSRHVPRRWATAHALTHFLLREDNPARKGFLKYAVEVFRGMQGDSSSTFDRTVGKIEAVENDWQSWMKKQTRQVQPKPGK